MQIRSSQIRRSAPYLAVASCSILYFAPFLRVLSHNGDEGTLITGAARVAEGQLPFRDFFEVMGPGTFYWLALFFRLLGSTWLTTRIFLLVDTTLLTLVLYYLARRLRCGREHIPVIFFIAVSFHGWNAVSHHMDSNLFGLGSLAALVAWIDHRRPFLLYLAGFGAGLTTWFMLPKGVFLFASFLLILGFLFRRGACALSVFRSLVLGYLVAILPVLALYWHAGGLPDLVYSNLLWPLTNYSGANAVPYGMEFRQLYWNAFTASLSTVFSITTSSAISAFLSIPFIVVMSLPALLLGFVVLWRHAAFDSVTIPYWLAGGALWISEIHRRDLAHIAAGSPVLILLTYFFVRRLTFPTHYVLRAVAAAAVTLALLNPLIALAAQHRTPTRRGVVYNAFSNNPVLDFINGRVSPGEGVFVYPYAPLYYFLGDVANPTRYSILMYGINTDAQFRETVAALEVKQVRYVIRDQSFPHWIHDWFPAYRIPRYSEQIVEPYLDSHYHVIGGQPDGYEFLERNDLPSPAGPQPVTALTKTKHQSNEVIP